MKHQLEIRHLKYFLAVAEELHFRKAADRLFISQPGLSRQIHQMEVNLGIQLFERHNRKVELTRAGSYLKNEITQHFNDLDRVFEQAKLINDGVEGHLKLGYVGSAMQEIIPHLLLKFRRHHPNVTFNLKELDNDKQIENLLHNTIDIGFVRLQRVPRGLKIKPVVKEHFCLVLPKNHPITEKNFKSLKQFENEAFILFDSKYSASYFEKVMQIFDDAGFSPVISHNTIHASSIYKLVEHGFGVSIVPKSLQNKNIKGIKFIELKKVPQKTVLSVVWSKTNRNPMLKKILAYL